MHTAAKSAAALIALAALASCSTAAPVPAGAPFPPLSAEAAALPVLAPAQDPAETLSAIPARFRAENGFRSCANAAIASCVSGPVTSEALRTADPALCDALPNEGAKRSCRTQVSVETAVRSADLSPCAEAGTGYAEGCRAEAARRLAAERSDASWCDLLPDGTAGGASAATPMPAYPQDACRVTAAASVSAEKAPAFCEKIRDEYLRGSCLRSVEERKNFPGLAPGMPAQPAGNATGKAPRPR